MRYFSCLLLVLLVGTCTETVKAQRYDHPVKHHHHSTAPIRYADPGAMGAQWLQAIEMTDYEVWIAKDTSKIVAYEVWLQTEFGWHVSGESVSGIHVQSRVFDSLTEAQLFAQLQMLVNSSNLDYRIVSHVPDMNWEYVGTFDSRAQAREFLAGLLDIIGDDYVGDIRKVTVIPAALR